MQISYEVSVVDIGKGEQFGGQVLRISPNNKIPAIIDDDGPEVTCLRFCKPFVPGEWPEFGRWIRRDVGTGTPLRCDCTELSSACGARSAHGHQRNQFAQGSPAITPLRPHIPASSRQ